MVEPTIIATFLLLLRPLEGLKGAEEVVDDCLGVGVVVPKLGVEAYEVGAVAGAELAEEIGMLVVLTDDAVVLDMLFIDEVLANAVGPSAVGCDAVLDTGVSPPCCESVHSTGFCPSCITMLKSLLMKVGGVALEVTRSDTWKWQTQAFPSSRGTRIEPVAETEWLYAG